MDADSSSFLFFPSFPYLSSPQDKFIHLSVCLSSPASVLMRDKTITLPLLPGHFSFLFYLLIEFLFHFDIDHDLELDTDS